jgi:hypothetical protein
MARKFTHMKIQTKKSSSDLIKKISDELDGEITADILLERAKNSKSQLHAFFNWDDTEAAYLYRVIQAKELIRRCKVTYLNEYNEVITVRAYVNVRDENTADEDDVATDDSRGKYVTFAKALNTPTYNEQMMQQCTRDIAIFQNKYSAFNAAKKIIQTMQDFLIQ